MGWTLIAFALAGNHPVEGTFVIEDPGALELAQAQAVEIAAAAFPWAIRPFARPRIRQHVWNCGRLGLRLLSDSVLVECDTHPPIELGGGARGAMWTDAEGQVFAVKLTVAPDLWELAFDGDRGTLTWRYRLDGEALAVSTEIRSALLPDPVGWVARYRRQLP